MSAMTLRIVEMLDGRVQDSQESWTTDKVDESIGQGFERFWGYATSVLAADAPLSQPPHRTATTWRACVRRVKADISQLTRAEVTTAEDSWTSPRPRRCLSIKLLRGANPNTVGFCLSGASYFLSGAR